MTTSPVAREKTVVQQKQSDVAAANKTGAANRPMMPNLSNALSLRSEYSFLLPCF